VGKSVQFDWLFSYRLFPNLSLRHMGIVRYFVFCHEKASKMIDVFSPQTATYAMLAVARLLLVLRFVRARFVLHGSTGF
jgi:preprotein translocase subunit Sec61beta